MSYFDWKKNKDVGNHLMKYSSKEEYQRSAVNRFYYSCFGPVKEYYEKAFRKTLPSKDAHQTLINSLKNSPFVEEVQLGKRLKNLRNQRNTADYITKSQKFSLKQSKRNVEKIHSILDKLKKNLVRIMKN